VKKQRVEVPKNKELAEVFESLLISGEIMENLKKRIQSMEWIVRAVLERIHPDIDWSAVHDLKVYPDAIELITYDHALEAIIGPMSEVEIEKTEALREQVQGAGLSSKVKKQ
jgi:hypothetical protein